MVLLDVQNLTVQLAMSGCRLDVLRDVSFQLDAGQAMGLIGESGSGKSLLALTIMGLLDHTVLRVTQGSIWFDGKNLLAMTPKARRHMMGRYMSMVFQEPMTSLNPVMTIGAQLVESLRASHGKNLR